MKKVLILIVLILFPKIVMAATPTRVYTYTSGNTIDPSQVTANEDALFNYFASGVETLANDAVTTSKILDGTIQSADILDGTIASADILDGTIATADIASIDSSEINFTSDITLTGTTPSITIGDAGEEDTQINFDGNAQDYHIGLDDTDDDFKIGLGTALGTTDHIVIDETGAVTQPLQPCFQVGKSAVQTNIATGSDVTLVWDSEIIDANNDFASNTFTAPVTGKYLLSWMLSFAEYDTASSFVIKIITSNRTYSYYFSAVDMTADGNMDRNMTVIADMDVNDTVTIAVNQTAGTAQMDINEGAGRSVFSGTLLN